MLFITIELSYKPVATQKHGWIWGTRAVQRFTWLSTAPPPPPPPTTTSSWLTDHFYKALFSAAEQTRCTLVACGAQWAWLLLYAACFEYLPKWCTYSANWLWHARAHHTPSNKNLQATVPFPPGCVQVEGKPGPAMMEQLCPWGKKCVPAADDWECGPVPEYLLCPPPPRPLPPNPFLDTRQCPQTTTFLKKRESQSGIEPKPFCLPA